MNAWTIARRSLWHYRRSNLAVFAGLAISAMTLVGALTVGDSVRHSLDHIARARIGQAHYAVLGQDRFVPEDLADRLKMQLGAPTAPVLLLRGHVARPDGSGRANDVQVLGVDTRFWAMAPGGTQTETNGTGLAINDHLAARLGLASGDAIVVRMGTPSDLPGDAPLSGEQDTQISWRGEVSAIMDDAAYGRFGLSANQVAPYNVFVPLGALQERTGRGDGVNLVLVGTNDDGLDADAVRQGLRQVWRIEDIGMTCAEIPDRGQLELRSTRVFIDPPVVQAALDMAPDEADGDPRPLPIVTYLANALAAHSNATPYSMVAALPIEPWFGLAPASVGECDMVVNTWLADDLGVRPGDEITAAYFVPGPMGALTETSAAFRVHSIVPVEGAANDPALMPDFPGLTEAESCSAWEPGFALDLGRIRDKDEAYWDTYRGTPKAFIPLATGTNLWRNRFGVFTAIRFPAAHYARDRVAASLRNGLDPASVGLRVEAIREVALTASGEAMSFGGLFLGLSMFLLAAALMLSGMLFAFGTASRSGETGLRLATGFTPRRVLGAYLREGLVVAAAATALGTVLGLAYTRVLLHGLATVWQGAVGQTALLYQANASSLAVGAGVNVAAALLTMAWVLRRQVRSPVHALLSTSGAPFERPPRRRGRRVTRLIAGTCMAGALAAVALAAATPGINAAPVFFVAGALLLGAGMFFCASLLGSSAGGIRPERLNNTRLVLLGLARRRGRSLGAMAMLACGTFMVLGVGASRPDLRGSAGKPRSGTGGFSFIAELSQPLTRDLNVADGRAQYGLDHETLDGVRFAQLRVLAGDDASCLNLNRAQRPRLLGVDPAAVAGRFTFAAVHSDFSMGEDGWDVLRAAPSDGRVPGVVDQNSLLWALGKKLGDTVTYTDAYGRPFDVVLAASLSGSILQGSIMVDAGRLADAFPSLAGYAMLLVDTTESDEDAVSAELYRGLEDFGVSIQPTWQRLARLNEVQNTYLSMFLLLGGLGLVLGTAGLGAVVLRNVMERRRELGVFRALGFRKRRINSMIVSEHVVLLLGGFACGLVAAVVGIMPSMLAPGAGVPYVWLGIITAAILVNGLLWTLLAAGLCLRGSMLDGLRGE